MTTYKLIRECGRLGILLTADGDSLKVDAPEGALTVDLRELLSKAKPELLAVLTDHQEMGFTWDSQKEAWVYL